VPKAFITGCAGLQLTAEERAFFAGEQPFGLILFKRNCAEPAQVSALTAAFRQATGRADAPVLIDQEGGRVQRMGPPHWPKYPPARTLALIAGSDIGRGVRAAWLHGRLIAADLADCGIDIDCAPVLDVAAQGMSEAIGDRAFGDNPQIVATLGRAVADGLIAGGVVPVIKHMPGHGRATADSHTVLPRVDADLQTLAACDFAPFKALADLPIAMTAHVIFAAVDPTRAATISPTVIRDIIRNRIGFDGLLMSDDISMHALSGDYSARAQSIYAAGCDLVLHCNGRTEEMREIGGAAPALGGKTQERAKRALSLRRIPAPLDIAAAREEFSTLLAGVGWREGAT
jgi:beta-N-acetylhexosaminidase